MMHSSKDNGRNAGSKPARVIAAASPSPPRLDSRELFRNGNEVVIVHKGEEYRLRMTRNEKLILTK
mgnify:CR=1 FL=1